MENKQEQNILMGTPLRTCQRHAVRKSMLRQQPYRWSPLLCLLTILGGCAEFTLPPAAELEVPIESDTTGESTAVRPGVDEISPEQESDNDRLETDNVRPNSDERPDDVQNEDNSVNLTEKEDSRLEDIFVVGSSCDVQSDCGNLDASCILETDSSISTPIGHGYCTFRDCETRTECPNDSVCHQPSNMNTSICVNSCASANDCSPGFSCIDSVCWIETPQPVIDPNRPLLRGTITFDHYAISPQGDGFRFELTGQRAATGLLAMVRDSQGTTIAQNWVDENGQYELQLERALEGDEEVVLAPALYLPNQQYVPLVIANPDASSTLEDYNGSAWAWTISVNSNTELPSLNITREQGAGAVIMFQQMAEAMATYANEHLGGDLSRLPSLAVWWSPNKSWACGACYLHFPGEVGNINVETNIFMTGNNLGGAWGTSVVYHELGHYISQNFSRDDSPGGPHTLGEPSYPALAMSEGFASFSALRHFSRLTGRPISRLDFVQDEFYYSIDYGIDRNAGAYGFTFPSPNGDLSDDIDEQIVTVALWQLWDGSEVGEDGINDDAQLTEQDIMHGMQSARYMTGDRGAFGADLIDLIDSIYCTPGADQQGISNVIYDVIGLPYSPPSNCN